jgi:hypothetical protein
VPRQKHMRQKMLGDEKVKDKQRHTNHVVE